MAKKHYSIDQLSTATSRRAQSEAAMMQSELKKLRASLLNMNRGIRAPKIKTKRTWTKRETDSSFLTELFGNGSSGSSGGFSFSFSESSSFFDLENSSQKGGYASNAQNANRVSESFSMSMRIR